MNDDLSQSVSQRGYGAYDEENRRIQKVSDELQRLCRLYEEKPREGKNGGGRFEVEQRIADKAIPNDELWQTIHHHRATLTSMSGVDYSVNIKEWR